MPDSFSRLFNTDELSQKVLEAGRIIGEPLYSSEDELQSMLELPIDDLKERYPIKFQAYLEARRGQEVNAHEFATRVSALNNIERFVESLETGESAISLYEHQKEVFRDLLEFFEAGETKGWIKLPTGAGKTAIFSSLAKATNLRTLILVPKTKLIDQTVDSLDRFGSGLSVTRYYGERKDLSGQVVVSTYQSFRSLIEASKDQQRYDLIICDEAHRALTPLTQDNLRAMGEKAVVVGLTATPDFNESKKVSHHFGELIHEMSIKEAILADILSGIRCVYILTDIDISNVTTMQTGEYNQKELEQALDVAKRNEAALKLLEQTQFRGRSAAVFCLSIEHSKKFADLANQRGIKAAHIDGSMSEAEREAIYEAYDSGDITLICSVDLLTEGWDAPRAEVAVNLRPTRSLVVAEQRGGRILRRYKTPEGKMKIGKIFDFLDKDDRRENGPITMVDVLGGAVVLPPSVESEWEGEIGGTPQFTLDIEGIEVVVDAQQIIELTGKEKMTEIPFTSKEQFIDVLKKVKQPKFEDLAKISGSVFLGMQLECDAFQGSGRTFIRKYNRDIKGTPEARILAGDVRDFFAELLGMEFDMSVRRQKIERMTTQDVLKFLRANLDKRIEEMIELPIEVGPSMSKIPVTVRELFAVLELPETEEGVAEFAKMAFSGRKDELAGGLLRERAELLQFAELTRTGELVTIVTSQPNLGLLTHNDFAKLHLFDSGRKSIDSARVLAHYEVNNIESYQKWIDELLGEDYCKEALKQFGLNLKEQLRNSDFSHFTTLGQFLRMTFSSPDGNTQVTGRHFFTLMHREPSHGYYQRLINSLMDNPKFCREFWPQNRRLMLKIIVDSLQAFFNTEKPPTPSFKQFLEIPLSSEYMERSSDLSEGRDLLSYWLGTKDLPDSTIMPRRAPLSRAGYIEFLKFLAEIK